LSLISESLLCSDSSIGILISLIISITPYITHEHKYFSVSSKKEDEEGFKYNTPITQYYFFSVPYISIRNSKYTTLPVAEFHTKQRGVGVYFILTEETKIKKINKNRIFFFKKENP